MYDASEDARNATAPATSSGCPNRFIGTFLAISLENSSKASFGSPVLPKIGVTIGPGATVFTRMPRPASSAAVVQQRKRLLDREVRSLDVDVKLLVEQAFGCIREWRKFRDSRVHKQHVNLAELLRNLGIQLVDVRELGHIRLHRQHTIANRLHRLVERLLAAAGNSHARPFLLEALCRSQPDAAVSPGYYRYFSFQPLHDHLPSWSAWFGKPLRSCDSYAAFPAFLISIFR